MCVCVYSNCPEFTTFYATDLHFLLPPQITSFRCLSVIDKPTELVTRIRLTTSSPCGYLFATTLVCGAFKSIAQTPYNNVGTILPCHTSAVAIDFIYNTKTTTHLFSRSLSLVGATTSVLSPIIIYHSPSSWFSLGRRN